MAKKAKTKAEKAYHDKVAQLPCMMCFVMGRQSRASVHHIREGQGASQRADHYLVIPLCYDCHQGPHGFHGDRAYMKIHKVEELDLLALTIAMLHARGIFNPTT